MCTALRSINIPTGAKVGGGAFYGCDALGTLDLTGCTLQRHEQFDAVVSRCAALEEIYLPENISLSEYIKIDNPVDPDNDRVSTYYFDYDDCPYIPTETDKKDTPVSEIRGIKGVALSRSGQYDKEEYQDAGSIQVELQECPALRKIHMSAASPENIYKQYAGEWSHLYETCRLCVPKGSLEAYKSVEPWSKFKSIVEDDEHSAIEYIGADAPFTEDAPRHIFDLSGCLRLTVAPGETPAGLVPGIYVERTPTASLKLIVH